MSEYTDEELLEQFRNPDTRNYAFNLLVRKHQQRLYWHVRRIVIDHDDANDVIQNVFIKVWKALDNFRADSQLYTWLYRIATNESVTFLNAKKKRFAVSLDGVENELSARTSFTHAVSAILPARRGASPVGDVCGSSELGPTGQRNDSRDGRLYVARAGER